MATRNRLSSTIRSFRLSLSRVFYRTQTPLSLSLSLPINDTNNVAASSSQPSGCKYLSLELCLDTYRETFYSQILPEVKPDWKPEDLDYHVFESGVTNTLVAFYQRKLGLQNSGSDVILLRVNGEGTEAIIDRTDEVVTILSLHKEGFCSPLYARLKNGLCYGFSPGRRLEVHETSSNSTIMRKVAELMARLHLVEVPSHFKNRKPVLWLKLDKMLKSIPTSFEDQDVQESFIASIGSIEHLKREIDATKDLILNKCHSPIVFCHNDIHSANLIYNKEADSLMLLDFEYAGPNYLAYDIANHFCEFAGVENVDYTKYPSEEVQKMWIRMYLEEKQKLDGEKAAVWDADVHNLYCDVNKMTLGCHLLWIVWGVFQAAHSKIEFDYMEYASIRHKEYMQKKEALLGCNF